MAFKLKPALKNYDWGDRHFIPELLELEADGRPFAEAWYGSHPSGPSELELSDGSTRPLDAWLEAGAHGPKGLPYLLKVLSAARPLSIQVHPSPEAARLGFEREEAAGIPRGSNARIFQDPFHKPELLRALSPFYALVGFRPQHEIAALLADAHEILAVCPALTHHEADLLGALGAYFALDEERLGEALTRWVERYQKETSAALTLDDPKRLLLWVHEAQKSAASPDRGLLFVLLLQPYQLRPGEALFLEAGVPHAYLQGQGVEIMASSDNVLRAGLTQKPIHPAELLRLLRVAPTGSPLRRLVRREDAQLGYFETPAREFVLEELSLKRPRDDRAEGAEILLWLGAPDTDQRLEVKAGADTLSLEKGQACLLLKGERYETRLSDMSQTESDWLLFRVRTNTRP